MRKSNTECDVRAAHARVFAPSQAQMNATLSTTLGSPSSHRANPDFLQAATPSTNSVPNAKHPFPLGSPPWTAGSVKFEYKGQKNVTGSEVLLVSVASHRPQRK